jgi:DnaJ-domain-containing protein 1
VNLTQVAMIAIAVASALEIVTRGRIGPLGILIGVIVALLVAAQGRNRNRASDHPHPEATPDSANYTSSTGPASCAAPENSDPYVVLGVSPDCSDQELNRAYRSLVRQWHPDQLEGMAEELRCHANTRLAEINRAFEQIKHHRK